MDGKASLMHGMRHENGVDDGRVSAGDSSRSESGERWIVPVRRLGVSMRELGITSCPNCGNRLNLGPVGETD